MDSCKNNDFKQKKSKRRQGGKLRTRTNHERERGNSEILYVIIIDLTADVNPNKLTLEIWITLR